MTNIINESRKNLKLRIVGTNRNRQTAEPSMPEGAFWQDMVKRKGIPRSPSACIYRFASKRFRGTTALVEVLHACHITGGGNLHLDEGEVHTSGKKKWQMYHKYRCLPWNNKQVLSLSMSCCARCSLKTAPARNLGSEHSAQDKLFSCLFSSHIVSQTWTCQWPTTWHFQYGVITNVTSLLFVSQSTRRFAYIEDVNTT